MWYLLGGAFLVASIWAYQKKEKSIGYMLNFINMVRSVPPEPLPAIHVAGNVYVIFYLHDGQVYKLYFPIRDEFKNLMKDKSVYLNIEDVNCDLSQQPGVPYLVRPNDFADEAVISVFSEDDDDVTTFRNYERIHT